MLNGTQRALDLKYPFSFDLHPEEANQILKFLKKWIFLRPHQIELSHRGVFSSMAYKGLSIRVSWRKLFFGLAASGVGTRDTSIWRDWRSLIGWIKMKSKSK